MVYTLRQYQNEVRRTATTHEREISTYALGLAGETGEVIDLLKKVWGHGHELDPQKLKKELGDCFWYVAALGLQFGVEIDDLTPRWFFGPERSSLTIQSQALRLAAEVGGLCRFLDLYWTDQMHNSANFDVLLTRRLRCIFTMLTKVCDHFALQLGGEDGVLTANIEKLRERYADGFSSEASKARVDTLDARRDRARVALADKLDAALEHQHELNSAMFATNPSYGTFISGF